MVNCPECGVENEEDASYCTRCGAPLKEGVPRVVYPRRRREKDEKAEKTEKAEKAEKAEKKEKDETEEKAELMEGDARNWVAFFGLLIILTGIISLIDAWYGVRWASWDSLWPILVIAVGLWIIWNGLRARTRSPRP